MTKPALPLFLLALLVGCPAAPPKPDDANPNSDGSGQGQKAEETAHIHYGLGVEAQKTGDVRTALNEYQTAIQADPRSFEAENGLGLLYHLSFRQLDESERHYRRALELKPDFTTAKVNLAALLLDENRYDEAIALDEEALKDLHYESSFLAANNEGWAYYRKGDAARALNLIRSAVRVNPEFCQGYRNLGIIDSDQGKLDLAQVELERMVKKCPDSPQGYYELGKVDLRLHQEEVAKKNFALCRDKAREGDPLLDDCVKLAGSEKP